MFDSFYISEEYIDEYITREEIEEITDAFNTKEPIIITAFEVGDIFGPQIMIDVGIGLISALTYDILKDIVFKIIKNIKKKHKKKAKGDPSPDINIRIDGSVSNINCTFKINCEASDKEIDNKVKEMKIMSEVIIKQYDENDFRTDIY